ncbi:hypothetical protein ACH5RR_021688 [Cinchona calisaya]|uniref:DUF4283 domain-containing protein n=1 Tax=Cinchona calisaya TaxID=153742 RepID=A0ABD2ZIW0_9GENT
MVNFSSSAVWVRLPELPMEYFNTQMLIKDRVQDLQYEWIIFFFKCGLIGHLMERCPESSNGEEIQSKSHNVVPLSIEKFNAAFDQIESKFGPWMKTKSGDGHNLGYGSSEGSDDLEKIRETLGYGSSEGSDDLEKIRETT